MLIEPCILWNPETGDEERVTTDTQYDLLISKGYEWLTDEIE